MTDDFTLNNWIVLQEGDYKVPYAFHFDDYLPSGTMISSVSITVLTSADVIVADIYVSDTIASNIVTALLSYPSVSDIGNYQIQFLLTLDNSHSSKLLAVFRRLKVV